MADHAASVKTGKYALPQKTYDLLKYLAQIVLPAAILLYTTLATAWDWGNVEATVITLGAINTFLGAVLKISSVSYNNADLQYDGTVNVSAQKSSFKDPETGDQLVEMLPHDLAIDLTGNEMAQKEEIRIKVNKLDRPES